MTRAEFDGFNDLALRRLACAIVRDAVDDYRETKRKIAIFNIELAYRQGEDDSEGVDEMNAVIELLNRNINLIIKFFNSRKFALLAPDLSPTAVIEALNRQADKADVWPDYVKWKKQEQRKKKRKQKQHEQHSISH